MKLWLISQDKNRDYDTYDSAVVAAESEAAAREMHPGGHTKSVSEMRSVWARAWVADLRLVRVRLIGTAIEGTEAGVICASFSAG